MTRTGHGASFRRTHGSPADRELDRALPGAVPRSMRNVYVPAGSGSYEPSQ